MGSKHATTIILPRVEVSENSQFEVYMIGPVSHHHLHLILNSTTNLDSDLEGFFFVKETTFPL